MKPHIGIAVKNLKSSATILSGILATETTLYLKTRKAHWNVAGESFMELHKLFQDHYEKLEASIDEIAERIGKLGHRTVGTMQEFIKLSKIKEEPDKYLSGKDLLKQLLKDHETIITAIREDIGSLNAKGNDLGTADFLIGILEQHETMAWVLRRYLK